MLTFEGFCWLLLLFAFVAVRYPCFAYVMQEGRKEGGKEGRKEGKKAARKEGRKEGEHLQVASLQSCAACSGQCREHETLVLEESYVTSGVSHGETTIILETRA